MNTQAYPETWHQHSFRAMGCQMAIWLDLADSQKASRLLKRAEFIFTEAERRLSRFDPTSELSEVNRWAGDWTRVSNILWQVVQLALTMARQTGGLFDPTQLNALEAAGYDRSFEELPRAVNQHKSHISSSTFSQWQAVELDTYEQAIYLPTGVRLDLGGIAKGYTAQQAVAFLSKWGPCLVDAGGDLTAGAAPRDWPGWPVGVYKPLETDRGREELTRLWLVEGSMATSGIDYRNWLSNGRLAHHVIDPRTGQPAETDLLTVTVLSGQAARAEAWATAALVAGSTIGLEQLASQNLAAVLVDQAAKVTMTPTLAPFLATNPQTIGV